MWVTEAFKKTIEELYNSYSILFIQFDVINDILFFLYLDL